MPPTPPPVNSLVSLLLENPWPLVVGLVFIAAVLRTLGKRNQRKPPVVVSWVALALGLGVYALASFVETDREALTARTRELVAATSPVDEAKLAGVLGDRAVLLGPEGNFWDDLAPGFVAREMKEHGVTGTSVRSIDAWSRTDTQGISLLEVSSQINGYPMRTTWEVTWTRPDDGTPGSASTPWRVASMRWLSWNGQPANQGLYR